MARYKIGVLKGDDIGLEIVPVAVAVLKAAIKKHPGAEIEWVELPVGYPSFLESGETLPERTFKTLYELDGWILGPIGHMAYPKDAPKAINPHPILRREFDLMSNIRPAKSFPTVPSLHKDVDIVIIRENNEGFQPDRNMYKGTAEFMPTPDMAMSLRVITRRNSDFVARSADALYQLRMLPRMFAHQEKSGAHVVPREDLQNLRRIRRIRPVVERQRHHRLARLRIPDEFRRRPRQHPNRPQRHAGKKRQNGRHRRTAQDQPSPPPGEFHSPNSTSARPALSAVESSRAEAEADDPTAHGAHRHRPRGAGVGLQAKAQPADRISARRLC